MFVFEEVVLMWVFFMTHFELWTEFSELLWCVLTMSLTPYKEEGGSSDEEDSSDEDGSSDEDNKTISLYNIDNECQCLSYWDQVLFDMSTMKKSQHVIDCLPDYYYPGHQPQIDWRHGPLIVSQTGKHCLNNIAVSKDLYNWRRVDRLSRFIILDPNETLLNSRSLDDVLHRFPSLIHVLPNWYGKPWFKTDRPLSSIRKELTCYCSGLQHLEFTHTYEVATTNGHIYAPRTVIISYPVPSHISNWRTHELWCMSIHFGWIVMRTILDTTTTSQCECGCECVYFYVSFFPNEFQTSNENEMLDNDMLFTYAQQMINMKNKYIQDQLDITWSIDMQFIHSTNWMMLK